MHLRLHKRIHDVSPFWCPLCLIEVHSQEALQQHLGEHDQYSVPCKYCDKSFLSKALCESHVKANHASTRERIVYKDPLILDRVDKEQRQLEPKVTNDPKPFVFRVYMWPNTEVEWQAPELDVTEENMRMMNVDFATSNCDRDSECSELVESERPPTESVQVTTVQSEVTGKSTTHKSLLESEVTQISLAVS